MRASTIEKNFLNPQRPGEKLLQVIFCDGSATIPPEGFPQLIYYDALKDRIRRIQALASERSKIPAPLLSGKEVMEILSVSPGPAVGKYLALVREEQLSGRLSNKEEAMDFLRGQKGSGESVRVEK
jgi:poly(A) polymerase